MKLKIKNERAKPKIIEKLKEYPVIKIACAKAEMVIFQ
jgi:hypothetical protein